MIHLVDHVTAQAELRALLDEASECNHVRIIYTPHGRRAELVHDTRADGAACSHPADLVRLDSLRVLAGKAPIWVPEALRQLGESELVSVTPNLRLAVGIDYLADAVGNASRGAVANYMALSNNNAGASTSHTSATTPLWGTNSSTDGAASSARGEITYASLGRAAATYAHTTGNTYFTQSHTWTASGTVTAVQIIALFNNASQGAGTGFVENVFNPVSVNNLDQLTAQWQVNF